MESILHCFSKVFGMMYPTRFANSTSGRVLRFLLFSLVALGNGPETRMTVFVLNRR